MGKALADAFPEAKAVFDEVDDALGEKLSAIVWDGPAEALTLTENAQPALMAVSLAVMRVLSAEKGLDLGETVQFVAGHSLGEYSALAAAGALTVADTARLLRIRGQAMQAAVPVGEGAMAAILGLAPELVQQACDEAAEGQVVSPANINAPGQVVIAGATAAVKRASERAKVLGAKRAIPLPVSAPFHCAMMKPAEERLAPELRALSVRDPRVPVVANVDAEPKRDAAAAIEALVRQVSAPVQWESVVRRLASDGVTTYVEVGPGRVLSGLVQKIHADARIFNFASSADLEEVEKWTSRKVEK
jgi:[acyl-carrier-protein] S-malonyltransferase